MNNLTNWLLAIIIVLLMGGGVWWVYSSNNPKYTDVGGTSTGGGTGATATGDSGANDPAAVTKLDIPISDADYILGPPDAPVQLVEYSDFQCPACQQLSPLFESMVDKFPGQVAFVYRHFPLEYHQNAMVMAQIAEAAGAQGKFYELHDFFFTNAPTDMEDAYAYAAELGLDVDQMRQEVADGIYTEKINANKQSGIASGVGGTPTLFMNGEQLPWEKTVDLEGTISAALGN